MELQDVTATLNKLRREVAKGSTPSVKREQELYSALLGLVEFVEELNASLDVAGITARPFEELTQLPLL